EVDYPRLKLALDQAGPSPPSGGQCLPDLLDRFEFGRVKIRKASVEVRAGGTHLAIPKAALAVRGQGTQLAVSVSTRGGSLELPGRTVGLISSRTAGVVDLRGTGTVELRRADVIGTEASAFVKGKLQNLCEPQIEAAANVRVDDLKGAAARLLPGSALAIQGGISADATVSFGRGPPHLRGDLRLKAVALDQFFPGDGHLRFDLTPSRVRLDRLEVPVGRGQVNGSVEVSLVDTTLPLAAELQLRAMELPESPRKLGLQHAWILLRTTGRVQAKGTLSPFRLAGETSLELADFAVLDRTYEKRPQARKMLEFARGKLIGTVLADPEKIVAQGVAIEVGAGSHVQVESTFFTDLRKGMQLAAHSEDLSLDDLRGHFGPLPAGGHVDGVMDVDGPVAAPSGTAAQELDDVSLWGESFKSGMARLSLRGGDPRLQIDELVLLHGEAALRVAGRFGPRWQPDIDGRTENFTLADLDFAQRARLSGAMRMTAHAGGVSSHPTVNVSLRFSEGMADEADLGDGDLSLTLDGKALSWKATVGTHGVTGQARLEGDSPYSCSGTLRVAELPQYVDL